MGTRLHSHAGTMSQRSIRSFFQAKPEAQATKPEKPKDKSEDEVGSSSKENVTPNTSQCAPGQDEIVESGHNNKQSSRIWGRSKMNMNKLMPCTPKKRNSLAN